MLSELEKLIEVRSRIYTECGLKMENFYREREGVGYGAHTFVLQGKKVLFRVAKQTPKKVGRFVTLWKRGEDNIILPYDKSDAVDFVVIAVSDGGGIGEFIFPKSILLEKKIMSVDKKGGKRALRVYTPQDNTVSPLASKTKQWQNHFFVSLDALSSETVQKIHRLYADEVNFDTDDSA